MLINFQEFGVNTRIKLHFFQRYLTLERLMESKATLFQICFTVLHTYFMWLHFQNLVALYL